MGICASQNLSPEQQKAKTEKNTSKGIDNTIGEDEKKDRMSNKLLLLGAGQSGKSTLFKQMNILYIEGFPERERAIYKLPVHNNVMHSIVRLCIASDQLGEKSPEYKVANELVSIKNEIISYTEDEPVTEELGQKILDLWADEGIQKTYGNRSKFQLNDSAAYFFKRLSEIVLPGYVPTEQDVLRIRVPTAGIVEIEFEIEGNHFRMFDVGGQRSERKKWIHCFENVTAVLFVAAISAYDLVLYEDSNQNRMVESLKLFQKTSSSEWLENTAMILFLNKSDIFREKIERVPLSKYFKDYVYTGIDTNYTEAVDFIVEMFEAKCKNVYTHVTVATDTNNICHVFASVKDIVIKKGLERAGLT